MESVGCSNQRQGSLRADEAFFLAASLSCFIIIVAGLSNGSIRLVQGHECVHDKYVIPRIQESKSRYPGKSSYSHAVRSRLLAEGTTAAPDPSPRPFRIKPVYSLDNLDLARQSFVKERLIPTAIGYFARLLKSRWRTPNPLLLPAPQCTTYCATGSAECYSRVPLQCNDIVAVPVEFYEAHSTCSCKDKGECLQVGGQGVPDADYILFVTANDTGCGQSTLAYAGHCIQGDQEIFHSRPIAGVVNFCTAMLQATDSFENTWDRQLWVALHEITHALGFSKELYSSYVDDTGAPRQNVTAAYNERGLTQVTKIVTPTVLSSVRSHFGCPTLNGAELEGPSSERDSLGPQTTGSHWAGRIFAGEYMVGVLDPADWVALSNLTFALLKDTGWYEVDFRMANYLHVGENLGCDFPLKDCSDPSNLDPTFNSLYCSAADLSRTISIPSTSSFSAQDSKQMLFCSQDSLGTAMCTDCDALGSSFCPIGKCTLKQGTQERCLDASQWMDVRSYQALGMTAGLFSRCFLTGDKLWSTDQNEFLPMGAGCFKVRCTASDDGGYSLKVAVGDTWFTCDDDQMIDITAAGYTSGRIGPCPRAADICPHAICPNDCNAKGQCDNGVCTCLPGYADTDCSQVACSPLTEGTDNCTLCDQTSGLCIGRDGQPERANFWMQAMGESVGATLSSNGAPVFSAQDSALTANPTPPASGNRKTPKDGVTVDSAIRFGGGDHARLKKNVTLQQDFVSNFRQQMSIGVKSVGYNGLFSVVINSINNGSIVVSSTTMFHDANSYELPDAFAALLRTDPTSIFKSGFFNSLPMGTVSTLNANSQAAPPGKTIDPPSKSQLRFRKFLGFSIIAWAVAVIIFFTVLSILCSGLRRLYTWHRKRQQPRTIVYQRNNIGPGTVEALALEGQTYPNGFPPAYAAPIRPPPTPTPQFYTPPPTSIPPSQPSHSQYPPPSNTFSGPPTHPPQPDAPAYYAPPPTWASNFPVDAAQSATTNSQPRPQ